MSCTRGTDTSTPGLRVEAARLATGNLINRPDRRGHRPVRPVRAGGGLDVVRPLRWRHLAQPTASQAAENSIRGSACPVDQARDGDEFRVMVVWANAESWQGRV